MCFGVLAPTAVAQPVIDPSEGVIQGRTAVSFWTEERDGGKLLEPKGFTAHLITVDDPMHPLVFPCGTWVAPPPGRYTYWIEGNGQISPEGHSMIHAGSPFQGKGMAAVRPVVPAGRVALAPASPWAERVRQGDLVLRLLHTESHNGGTEPRPEMARQAFREPALDGVAMPVGRVLAGIFDPKLGEYIALARPETVPGGGVLQVNPQPPRQSTDLVVVLDRHQTATDFNDYELALAAVGQDGKEYLPAVEIPSAGRHFAVWYGLPERLVQVKALSAGSFLKPREVVLRPGKVERLHEALVPLPSLEISIQKPPDLPVPPGSTLEVRELPGKKPVYTASVTAAVQEIRIDHLPAAQHHVVLDMPSVYRVLPVDLRAGDGAVTFEIEPTFLSGTVYVGDEGAAAQLKFTTRSGPEYEIEASADEDGEYEVTLFGSGFYRVFLRPEGHPGPAIMEFLYDEPIQGVAEVDFHLPDNRFVVRVVDEETGEPIEMATVRMHSQHSKGANTRKLETDDEGRVHLELIRPGQLKMYAEAEGYSLLGPVDVDVTEDDRGREIELAMRALGEGGRLQLHQSAGSPAVGAEVLALSSLETAMATWQGRSDVRGEVEIPDIAEGGFLAIKHPATGFAVRPWAVSKGDPVVWNLPAAAPPLRLAIQTPEGEPVPSARVTLWIGQQALSGSTLQWLTGGNMADASGLWQGTGLPAGPVEVLAVAPQADVGTASRSLSTTIPYPWSSILVLRAHL